MTNERVVFKSTGQARRRNRRRRKKVFDIIRRKVVRLVAAAKSLRQIKFVYDEVRL
jgi:hypothetical protein